MKTREREVAPGRDGLLEYILGTREQNLQIAKKSELHQCITELHHLKVLGPRGLL